jgi:CHAT domain-containing protein
MSCTPAQQQALDRAESAAFMRNFYASLGMRKQILERALQQAREPHLLAQPASAQLARASRQPAETKQGSGSPRRK